MRINLIRISNEILLGKKQDSITQYLGRRLLELGAALSKQITVQNNSEHILNALKDNTNDFTFIVGESTTQKNAGIKKTLAGFLHMEQDRNFDAITNIKNYYNRAGEEIPPEAEEEMVFPTGASVFPCSTSVLQSYVIKQAKTYIFLPDNLQTVKEVFETSIKPIIEEILHVKYKTAVFKIFGLSEQAVYEHLGDLIKNKHKILFVTYPNDLDVTLLLRYEETLPEDTVQQYIITIYEKLNKYIYADCDVTLAEQACRMLTLYKKKLAVCERVTAGAILSTLQREGASNYLSQGVVCLHPESLIQLLHVNQTLLQQQGENSIEVAYETAAGLLDLTQADIVAATTNYVETKGGKTTFIAVGNTDGIHVYKNTFRGSNDKIALNIMQTTFFYLIKNIKQNDLFLQQTLL